MATGFGIAAQNTTGKAAGFTIVELMLATAVFSLVLLAALGSFLQIGRLFYKGVSLTNTQNVATSVLTDINTGMQTSATIQPNTVANGYHYLCVGNTRYTYTTHVDSGGQQVSNIADSSRATSYSSGAGGTFGLLKDTGCGPPCAPGGGCGLPLTNPTEMLGDQMRVANLQILQANSIHNLYNVSLVVAYGSDSVFDFTNTLQPACNGGSSTQAFCSVVNLSTSVFAGTHT